MFLTSGYPNYFQVYSGVVVAASVADTALSLYHSSLREERAKKASQKGLAVIRTLQNLSFLMPIAWFACAWYKQLEERGGRIPYDPDKVLFTAPFGVIMYLLGRHAVNPILALNPPRALNPKMFQPHVTLLICQSFQILNAIAFWVACVDSKLSIMTAVVAAGACGVNAIARQYLYRR